MAISGFIAEKPKNRTYPKVVGRLDIRPNNFCCRKNQEVRNFDISSFYAKNTNDVIFLVSMNFWETYKNEIW